jgi:hypothetical protein
MAVVAISRQGLAAIAIAVALLWGCIFAEGRIAHRAAAVQARALRDLRWLRQRTVQPVPVAVPQSPFVRHPRAVNG